MTEAEYYELQNYIQAVREEVEDGDFVLWDRFPCEDGSEFVSIYTLTGKFYAVVVSQENLDKPFKV